MLENRLEIKVIARHNICEIFSFSYDRASQVKEGNRGLTVVQEYQ